MSEQAEIQRTIVKALAKRNKARSKKMWSVADDIRNMLKEMGVLIQDTGPNTSEWRWAKGALQDSEEEEEEDGGDDSDSAEAPPPAPAPKKKRAASADEEEAPKKKRKKPEPPAEAAEPEPPKRSKSARKRAAAAAARERKAKAVKAEKKAKRKERWRQEGIKNKKAAGGRVQRQSEKHGESRWGKKDGEDAPKPGPKKS